MKLYSYYHSTDRNYIFLLCNGILILIIKNSGLLAIAPSNTDHFRDNYAKKNVQSHQSNGFREYNVKKNTQQNRYSSFSDVPSQTNAEEITKAVIEVDKAERAIITFTDEIGEKVTFIEEKEEEEVDELLNIVKEEEEKEEEEEEEEEEEKEEEEEFVNMEEEEEGIELLSREELNKKCEEFIRKMKYGIKFEAQHHLIMV